MCTKVGLNFFIAGLMVTFSPFNRIWSLSLSILYTVSSFANVIIK